MNTIETIAYTLLGLLAASTVWLVVDQLIHIIRLSRQIRNTKQEIHKLEREIEEIEAEIKTRLAALDPTSAWDYVPEVIASDCAEASTKPSASLRAGVSVQKGGVQ